MIKSYSGFKCPNEEDVLWRYLSLRKFISLLINKALHFTFASKFEDKLEGSRPIKEIKARENKIGIDNSITFGHVSESFKSKIGISCWHQNTYESAAMWKLYSEKNQGIAIKTSFNSLKKALDSSFEGKIYVSKVKYIDYKKDRLSTSDGVNPLNDLLPYIHKYKSYKYEQEVRAIVWPEQDGIDVKKTEFGFQIPISLNQLIEKIYLSPNVTDSFYCLVNELLDKCSFEELSDCIEKSNLDTEALY